MSAPAPIYPYTNTPAAIDLTVLAAVKDYIAQGGGAVISAPALIADDTIIQGLITGCSQMWLTKTSRTTLNSSASYTENYDGNGSIRLFPDNWPLISVASLQVNGQAIPPSVAVGQAGYFIERSKRSIALRPVGASGVQTTIGFGYGYPFKFDVQGGPGNVALIYTAGYTGIPNDIFEAVTWQVAQAYKKRESINLESLQMGGGAGSSTYVKWDWTPEVKATLRDYTKVVVSGS